MLLFLGAPCRLGLHVPCRLPVLKFAVALLLLRPLTPVCATFLASAGVAHPARQLEWGLAPSEEVFIAANAPLGCTAFLYFTRIAIPGTLTQRLQKSLGSAKSV